MFPQLSLWLMLPLGPRLPKWASASFSDLGIACFCLVLKPTVPLLGKVMVGLLVVLHSLAFLAAAIWATGCLTLWVGRRLGQTTQRLPEGGGASLLAALGGPVGVVPTAVFWVWGLFYLAGGHSRLVNRVSLATWAALGVTGCVLACVNWARGWAASRRHGTEAVE